MLLLAAVLQATLFTRLTVFGAVPNLVLLLAVAWTLLRGAQEGFVWAFVGGLALDLLSGGPFGLSAMALLVVCALVGLTEGHLQSHTIVLAIGAAALGSVLFDALILLGLVVGGHPLTALGSLASGTLAATAANALVMFPVHWLMLRLYHAAEQSEVRLRP